MNLSDIKPFARYVRHFELTPESKYPEWVPADARLFFCVSGCGKIYTSEGMRVLKPGSMLYVNSGNVYRHMPGNVSYLAVNFDFTQDFNYMTTPVALINLDELNIKHPLKMTKIDDAPCFDKYCFFEDFYSLQKHLEALEKEFVQKFSFYREKTSAILINILASIARRAERHDSSNTRFDIEKIVEYINLHYAENIDNATLSKIFHFHPNYISAEFKRCTGKPLHKYVLEMRLLNAISLMELGNTNISQIASLTGFSDSNYFCRYFKQVMGTTPKKYIQSYAKTMNR